MNTDEKINKVAELMGELTNLFLGHITNLNNIDELLLRGREIHTKLEQLRSL